ncbi:MAG TPA: hypothetical protein VI731_09170 [Bacteroidia bacterium]|nr:hypothetical protein [Bacteroidia bacterium]
MPWSGILGLSAYSFVERFTWYSVRAVLIIYMLEFPGFTGTDASTVYGNFTVSIYLLAFLGALAGDFLLTPIRTLILGAILQAAGCFFLAVPQTEFLYAGLVLLALSTGLTKPNLFAQYAAIFHGKRHFMASGAALIYIAINLGAFIAPFFAGSLANSTPPDFQLLFNSVALISLLSIIPLFLNFRRFETNYADHRNSPSENHTGGWIALISMLFLLPVFWTIYQVLTAGIWTRCPLPHIGELLIATATILFSLTLAICFWHFSKINILFSAAFGFLFCLLAVIFNRMMGPCNPAAPASLLAAELLIVIPAYAIVGRYAPRKLTSLFYALFGLCAFASNKLAHGVKDFIAGNGTVAALWIFIAVIIVAIILLAFTGFLIRRKFPE